MSRELKRYLDIFLLVLVCTIVVMPNFLLAANDELPRGMIGLGIIDASKDRSAHFYLKDRNGALVVQVAEDLLAEKAGVRVGDLIVEINGRKIKNADEVLRIIPDPLRIGNKFTIKVIRYGKEKQINITVVDLYNTELPKDPILRIEAGMHTASIKHIDVDRENRWLVTASDDKTARLWELPSGRLVQVIRPPIGKGDEGKLFAVAISPDGRQIACGGFTAEHGRRESHKVPQKFVYLFNTETGQLMGQIMVHAHDIRHLAYSPDGVFLVLCKGSAGMGVSLYRTDGLSLVGSDSHDIGDIHGAAFAPDGRLVTSSHSSKEGYLRLYSRDFRLLAQEKTLGGNKPFQVSFSPDGGKIVVGFEDSTQINVLSARDLSYLFSPDTTGISNGNLASVSWSDNGQVLYAGGTYNDGAGCAIIRWPDAGRGKRTILPGASNTITDIRPLKNGGFVYGANDPAIGVYDGTSHRQIYLATATADFRENLKGFLVAPDGERVQFSYEKLGKTPARFSVTSRQLEINPTPDVGISPPIIETPGLKIKNLEFMEREFMEYKGIKLPINPTGYPRVIAKDRNGSTSFRDVLTRDNESYTSLAISPDGRSFLLGATGSLNLFDRYAELEWRVPAPAEVWAVNITGNSKAAVAAFGDGTIRWYNMVDGKEILAFFPHNDKKRWVMWTPEGYFDASEGGAKLIGYHINQGEQKEATFIPMENLYDVFYRPDIVASKFRGEDISRLITLTAMDALKNPPPSVEFTTKITDTDKTNIKVCYRVSSKGGGIGDVRLFHNAKLIKSDGHYREYAQSKKKPMQIAALNSRAIQEEQMRSLKVLHKGQSIITSSDKGDVYENCADVEAIAGENEIAVTAFNKENTVQGFLETMTFNANITPVEPQVYVLIAGIDRYQDKSATLKYAVKDAKDIHKKLTVQLSTLFKKDKIRTMIMTNEEVTKSGLLTMLDSLAKEIRPGDYFILFTAGHGVLIQNQYYLLTQDYRGNLGTYCMISSNEIVEATKKIKSLNQLLIFDTCHAGGMDNVVSGLYDARMAVIAKKMGLHIYASASSLEGAMDGYKSNGLFTHTLLDGLNNNKEADKYKEGKVSIVGLGEYARKMTTAISKEIGHSQTPLIINFGKDSPLYQLR